MCCEIVQEALRSISGKSVEKLESGGLANFNQLDFLHCLIPRVVNSFLSRHLVQFFGICSTLIAWQKNGCTRQYISV